MKDEFTYNLARHGDIPVFHLTGSFDMNCKDEFQAEIESYLQNDKPQFVIFNLKGLEYIDSSALGVLVSVLKNLKSHSGDVYVTNVSDFIEEVFKRVRLDKYFIVMSSDLRAISEIRGKHNG